MTAPRNPRRWRLGGRPNVFAFFLFVVCLASCSGCEPSDKGPGAGGQTPDNQVIQELAASFAMDKERATSRIKHFASAPHAFGSEAQKATAAWLLDQVRPYADHSEELAFTSQVPNPVFVTNPNAPANLTLARSGANLVAIPKGSLEKDCLVLFGSHYDTKILESTDYLGANDSGSSSILLLDLAEYLAQTEISGYRCGFAMVWFDGEEAVLANWNDGINSHPAKIQDNTYGSRDFVAGLSPCKFDGDDALCQPFDGGKKSVPVIALVLLDMVGSPDIRLSLESNSTPSLTALLKQADAFFSAGRRLSAQAQDIQDDHIPFLKRGIAAIDLIDFTHVSVWHQAGDDPEKVDIASMEYAGKVAVFVGASVASSPRDYLLSPTD